jgi:hypothetical protein
MKENDSVGLSFWPQILDGHFVGCIVCGRCEHSECGAASGCATRDLARHADFAYNKYRVLDT